MLRNKTERFPLWKIAFTRELRACNWAHYNVFGKFRNKVYIFNLKNAVYLYFYDIIAMANVFRVISMLKSRASIYTNIGKNS